MNHDSQTIQQQGRQVHFPRKTAIGSLQCGESSESAGRKAKIENADISTPGEKWAVIPDFPNYFISSEGRVCSVFNGRVRLKATYAKHNGYIGLYIGRFGEGKNFLVHRLILLAFVGPCPAGMEAAHKDGTRDGNRLNNLQWKTHLDNSADKHAHGTFLTGEQCGSAKLSNEQRDHLRAMFNSGMKRSHIAAAFNISLRNVYYVGNSVN